jgi:hypothetical protein
MAATQTDDPFAQPNLDFLRYNDLIGRHIIIKPLEKSTGTGTDGKVYDKAICDVIVLDGEVTDQIPEIPFVVEGMHISTSSIVQTLISYIKKDQPIIGKAFGTPSARNRNVIAGNLDTSVSPETKEKLHARDAWRKYLAERDTPPF